MVTEHIFNLCSPELGDVLLFPYPVEVELANVRCFKYADYEYAYRNCANSYVRHVLDKMPILGKHKRVLIDIKIHDLKPGEIPCIPGWHLDGSINPKDLPKRPEVFTLFITGEYGVDSTTQFLDLPIRLSVEDSWNFATMSRKCSRLIPTNYPIWSMPASQFVTYGDFHFHRGKAATHSQKRLLIRTTETDIITPQNRIYIPYTHARKKI